jgi:hypothetical protein
MSNPSEGRPETSGASARTGNQVARIASIVGLNLALVALAVVFASSRGGKLPDLNASTLAVATLPVSAALGLVLACRRLDFSLPVILVVAIALQTKRHFLASDPLLSMSMVCGIAGGVGLLNALVTWYGRISSALWTGALAFGLWLLMSMLKIEGTGPGPWPWPWALAASVGFLLAGAAVLGITGLVSLPSLPPILRSGSNGFAGLAGSWIVAAIAVAMASQSAAARMPPGELQAAYPRMLAAAALSGAFILRGRYGALAAVLLTCLGHLAWSFAWNTDFGNRTWDLVVPAAAPLVAIPLYLVIDWFVRQRSGESAPTGLLA